MPAAARLAITGTATRRLEYWRERLDHLARGDKHVSQWDEIMKADADQHGGH